MSIPRRRKTSPRQLSGQTSPRQRYAKQVTLRDDQVSAVFREPGVRTGYRPPGRRWSYYLASLVHVTNETVNVWTHLLGCLLLIYELCSYAASHGLWEDDSRRVIHIFNLCNVLYALFSTVAHTFHSRSEFVHYICFQADYAGISLTTYACGLGAFYVCCRHAKLFGALEPVFLTLNTVLAWLSYLGCSLAKVKGNKNYCFLRKTLQIGAITVQTLLSCAAVFIRYIECAVDKNCHMSSMNHHTYYIIVLAVSVMFFASHIPERFSPGRFDFVGQGHQIFHVLILCFTFLQQSAAEIEIGLMKQSFPRKIPSWSMLFSSFFTVIILEALTVVVLSKYVEQGKDKRKL